MELQAFKAILADEGYTNLVTVEREANGALDWHTHPFEAKAIILEGEIRIQYDGKNDRYQVGEIFHLAAEVPHQEQYGPSGVKYLVGRK